MPTASESPTASPIRKVNQASSVSGEWPSALQFEVFHSHFIQLLARFGLHQRVQRVAPCTVFRSHFGPFMSFARGLFCFTKKRLVKLFAHLLPTFLCLNVSTFPRRPAAFVQASGGRRVNNHSIHARDMRVIRFPFDNAFVNGLSSHCTARYRNGHKSNQSHLSFPSCQFADQASSAPHGNHGDNKSRSAK